MIAALSSARPWAFLLAILLAGGGIGQAIARAKAVAAARPALSAEAVNDAVFAPGKVSDRASPMVLKAQILLDRASISPGQIDGRYGGNMQKAINEFQAVRGLDRTGTLDKQVWNELTQGTNGPVIVKYVIAEADVKGPFTRKIPHRLEEMARLPRLSYTGPLQLLAEKFHAAPKLLQGLNPGARFDAAGTSILVPDVGSRPAGAVAEIDVDKSTRDVRALGEHGELVAFYPATIGSREKPAPSGRYKVRAIDYNPTYWYNPKFHFKGVHAHHELRIAPGPNNPVGLAWIDLTKPSYGIHGTPDPSLIGKSFSHGCIRLTNWDALDLARRVRKGTPVTFSIAGMRQWRGAQPDDGDWSLLAAQAGDSL
jgi:lipoprotein-anchoring transpeptidase ErfK/SrfK